MKVTVTLEDAVTAKSTGNLGSRLPPSCRHPWPACPALPPSLCTLRGHTRAPGLTGDGGLNPGPSTAWRLRPCTPRGSATTNAGTHIRLRGTALQAPLVYRLSWSPQLGRRICHKELHRKVAAAPARGSNPGAFPMSPNIGPPQKAPVRDAAGGIHGELSRPSLWGAPHFHVMRTHRFPPPLRHPWQTHPPGPAHWGPGDARNGSSDTVGEAAARAPAMMTVPGDVTSSHSGLIPGKWI